MATKDNSTGLLSKMAKFVRNPTKDWSELDTPEPESEQESGYSKQALKEMIERKRQNDFVRRREFDQLRKLRRNEPSINPDLAGRPSFFQSSMASHPDERAVTLKKIDEIEAQMSKQWWKGKQDEASVQGSNFPMSSKPPLADEQVESSDAAEKDGENVFSSTQPSELVADLYQQQGADYEPTQMGLPEPASLAPPAGLPRSGSVYAGSVSRNFDAGISGYSHSQLLSVEMGEGLADPDLEEAAIRFANGDDAGAEQGLLNALQGDNVQPDLADRWAAALFDLYRATGQQLNFDRVAIDYAQRFGRSAPAWFSTPELLGRSGGASPAGRAATPASGDQSVWECPAGLDAQAVQGLRAVASRVGVPLHLNWSRLGGIAPDAAVALAELFAQWSMQPLKLYFGGADVLERVLRASTPSGDKRVDACWWRLRLDALRMMRLQDEFELAALDYCVTFEVSPPAWTDARCEYFVERLASSNTFENGFGAADGGGPAPYADMSQAPTALMGLDAIPAAVVELTGEVLGDAADALDKLQAGLKGADRLVISCARLIRVDFSAAGSILNWVAVRESEGCHVQFREVPRLVAAFFNVIGINEHARVVLRTS